MKPTQIESVDSYDWTEILAASQAEGHDMVNRLLAGFRAGTNRFAAPGEVLVAHLQGNAVVAVAGLNVEPGKRLGRGGRVRRLYVVPRCRGNGLARGLVDQIASYAARQFDVLTVNVGKLDARGFYEHLGFKQVEHPGITHVKEMAHNNGAHSIPERRASAPSRNE